MDEERLKKINEELDSYRRVIFDFSNTEFKPFRKNTNLNNGFYLTIRCGLTGIYTVVNEWKNGMWYLEILDGSTTIAYSNEKLNLSFIKNETENSNNS